jgi:hypothetical protein
MSTLEIVIADSLVPADFAPDLLRGMALAGIDTLAAQGLAVESRAPHADLLPAHLGWPMRNAETVDVALGWSEHAHLPKKAPGFERYLVQPVHLDVGSHGLILADPAALPVSEEEAAGLIEAVQPLLQDMQIQVIDSDHWLLTIKAPFSLQGAIPEAALGRDILPWLPTGEAKRKWSGLANEIQMVWHDHPLNEARVERGIAPINALWLAGDSRPAEGALLPYRVVTGAPPWFAAWPSDAHASAELRIVTSLISASRDEDWSAYRNILMGVDQVVQDALSDLKSGQLSELLVAFTGNNWIRACTVRRSDLYKFWRRGKACEVIDCPQ